MKTETEKIIELCRDALLKQLHPMTHENGYPCEAVAKATILSLPALMKPAESHSEQAHEEGKKEYCSCKVRCDLCTHEWIAVYPSSADKLECPHCRNNGKFTIVIDLIKQHGQA